MLLFSFVYFVGFEYLRQLGPDYFVERVFITNVPAIFFVLLSIFWAYRANQLDPSSQLKILISVLITLAIFLFIRLRHILVYGAPGVGSIYQEQEQWVLWVRVINGALIFLSTLILHNYFFKKNWQQGILITAENTKIKELLLERDSLISSLIKANKTASTGALSASIAHELSQPLGASGLNIQFLKLKLQEGELNPKLHMELLNALESDNQRAVKIIQSLRSIFIESKVDSSRINVQQAIKSVLEIATPELKKNNIHIQSDMDESLEIALTPSEFHQVLLNLLNNAIQALTQKNDSAVVRKIWIKAHQINEAISISITDNGPGVPEFMLQNLFELLSTSKDTGMGLGLWLCKHIVSLHSGSISHVRPRDGGSQFVMRFPLVS